MNNNNYNNNYYYNIDVIIDHRPAIATKLAF